MKKGRKSLWKSKNLKQRNSISSKGFWLFFSNIFCCCIW